MFIFLSKKTGSKYVLLLPGQRGRCFQRTQPPLSSNKVEDLESLQLISLLDFGVLILCFLKMSMATNYRYECERPGAKNLRKALKRQEERIKVCGSSFPIVNLTQFCMIFAKFCILLFHVDYEQIICIVRL